MTGCLDDNEASEFASGSLGKDASVRVDLTQAPLAGQNKSGHGPTYSASRGGFYPYSGHEVTTRTG